MKAATKQTCRLLLEITDHGVKRTTYAIVPIRSEFEEHVRAYQVRNLSTQAVYAVTQERSGRRQCDCAFGTLQASRACRHVRAMGGAGLFLTPKELAALNRSEPHR